MLSKFLNQRWGYKNCKKETKTPNKASIAAATGSLNVVGVVDKIFQDALRDGTSDIHIEVFKDNVAKVRYRNDGIMKIQESFDPILAPNYMAVVTRLKIMAGCNISESRLPQDGAITVQDKSNNGIDVDVRFNTVPTKYGERIV